MGAKARTRCRYDVGFFEEEIKEVPALHAVRCLYPGVRRVGSAVDGETGFGQAVADDVGIFHVVLDVSQALFLAFRAVVSFGSALDDVRCAVEEGALTTVPQGIEFDGRAVFFIRRAGMGNDDVGAAGAREAGTFGVGAQFDGDFFGPFDFKDAVRNVRFSDVRFIGRVIDDDEVIFFAAATQFASSSLLMAVPVGLEGLQR